MVCQCVVPINIVSVICFTYGVFCVYHAAAAEHVHQLMYNDEERENLKRRQLAKRTFSRKNYFPFVILFVFSIYIVYVPVLSAILQLGLRHQYHMVVVWVAVCRNSISSHSNSSNRYFYVVLLFSSFEGNVPRLLIADTKDSVFTTCFCYFGVQMGGGMGGAQASKTIWVPNDRVCCKYWVCILHALR